MQKQKRFKFGVFLLKTSHFGGIIPLLERSEPRLRGEAAGPGDCYSGKISRSEPRLGEAEEKATLKVMCWSEARLGLKDRGMRCLSRAF